MGILFLNYYFNYLKIFSLKGNYEEGSLNIVTLLLSGRATPYLHNGVVYVGDEDHYALPQFGKLTFI